MEDRKIAKNTIMLYVRMILLMLINLYASRIVLKELGVDDYGIYNVVGGIIAILSFLNSAMAGGTQRFLNIYLGQNNQVALHTAFTTSRQIHFGVSAIIFILAETIGLWYLNCQMNIGENRIHAANWVYQFSVITAILNIISVPYNAAIISHEKMSAFAYISILEAVLKLGAVLLLMWCNFDKLIVYSALICFVGVIIRIAYGTYSSSHFEECGCFSWKINHEMMNNMLSFSCWTIFGNLGYILHTYGIALIINAFFSLAVNTAQGIANQVNAIVTQFSNNFIVAMNPQIVKTYATGDFSEMQKLIWLGCKISFCMMSFFVVPLIVECSQLLQLWLVNVPDYTCTFVRLILLISLINSFSSLLSTAKGATGSIKKYQITLTLIGALHLPFAWIAFVMGAGPEYSMYIYLLIAIVLQIVRIIFVCKSLKFSLSSFFQKVIMRCFYVLFVSFALAYCLHYFMEKCIIVSILICIISCVAVTVSTMFIGFSTNERNVIYALVRQKVKFVK